MALVFRVNYLKSMISFPSKEYYTSVVIKFLVVIPLLTIPELYLLSEIVGSGFTKILVISVASIIIIIPLTFFIGFDKNERVTIQSMLISKLNKHK